MKQNKKIVYNENDGSLITAPKKDVLNFIKSKVLSFQEIIKKSILAVHKYKFLDILGAKEGLANFNPRRDLIDSFAWSSTGASRKTAAKNSSKKSV